MSSHLATRLRSSLNPRSVDYTANRAATGEDDRRPGVMGGLMANLDAGYVRYQVVKTGFECVRVGVSHGLERLRG